MQRWALARESCSKFGKCESVAFKNLLLGLLLALMALAAFPPTAPGSSVFYVSASFFLVALLLSSTGKGFKFGVDYLQLLPKKGRLPSLAAWGIATGIAALLITPAISLLLYYAGALDSELVSQKVSSLPPIALLLAFTLAPLGEEALFRGYLFRKISERLSSPMAGAIISSLLFSALHFMYGSVAEIIVAFAMGLLFCASAKKAGSLVPAVVAHATYNLISIAVMVLF